MTLNLRQKILGGFGLVLAVFALAGVLAILNLREQRDVVHEILVNDQPMVDKLNETAMLLQVYRKAEKDVLLSIGKPDAQAAYRKKLKELGDKTRADLAELDRATKANEDLSKEAHALPKDAAEAFARYDDLVQALADKLVADTSGRGMDALEANALLTKGKEHIHRAEKDLETLGGEGARMFKDNQQTLAQLAGRTETLLMAAIVLSMLIGVGSAALTLLSITRPLSRIMSLAGAVASGDLNASASGSFTAEMATLKASIDAMLVALKAKIAEADGQTAAASREAERASVAMEEAHEAKAQAERAKAEGMLQAARQLEDVVEIVRGASQDLNSQVALSSKGTDEQSARISETATAMEEMNATVLEVARSAGQASESSDQARRKAEEGQRIVGQVVEGIGAMQGVSATLRGDMAALGKQAEAIGQIMNVISDIADQTNLLALNAAIEAARAGDAGRGFAVVADEVRKLAEKTMTATREVGEAISGIQSGTRKNLDNVEHAVATVDKATALAQSSGQTLREIVELVEASSDQVRAIATASEEQSSASEEINRSIEDINRLSAENAGAMRQASEAVRELIEDMKRQG